ncbi:MAG: SMC family ATPase [Thermocrinis sp.]|nr:SMC family ATPase [Thermocrinis sp.]
MRPIRLELENFTIFRGRHSVDFSGLRFFIIQGRTGAGKTSLIDAMCYALFGKVPRHGDRRDLHEHLISKGTDHMRVFLEFSVRDKRYAIERAVRKGRGEVRFWEGNKPKNVKANELPELIKRVLGVDYDTFTKVILLPQGQFDRFLKPERPQQRREILNKLLGVDTLIEKMAELIRETKRQIENRLESITASLRELSFATKEELDRVNKEITLLEKDLNLLEEERKKLQERLNIASHRDRLQEELTECQRQLAELLEKAEKMEQLERDLQVMEELSSYAPYVESFKSLSQREEQEIKEIRSLREKLAKLSHQREQFQIQLEKYRQEWERLGEYDVQIEQLTKELERLKNALEKHRERNQKLKELENVEEEIKTLEEEIRNLTERIDRGENYIKELREKIEDLEEKQRRLLELNPIKIKLDEVRRERESLELLKKEKEGLEEQLEKIRKDIKEKESSLIRFHVEHIRTHLKEGDLCPVCGNVITQLPPTEPSENFETIKRELDKLKALESEHLEKKARIESKLSALEEKERELRQLLDKWEEEERFEEEYRELQKAQAELEEGRRKLKQAEEKLKNLKEELSTKRERLSIQQGRREKLQTSIKEIEEYLAVEGFWEVKEQDIREKQTQLKTLKDRRDTIRNSYTTISEQLRNVELEEKRVQTALLERERNIQSLKEEKERVAKNLEPAIKKFGLGTVQELEKLIKPKEYIERLKQELEDYKRNVALLKEKEQRLKEELKDFEGVEPTQEIKAKVQQVEEEYKNKSVQLGHLREQKTRIEEGLRRREELLKDQEELQRKEGIYRILERDFRADRLQEFLSQIMLQKIIARANFYLQKFTSGAYEYDLEGSDILVIDRLSGHKRSVSTLSGGETFLASLSLAFGVSDIISKNAPIESLFIDEGFGSLDRETREELSQFFEMIKLNANRMVGIISHLEDLAEKFDQRIEVVRRGDRSFVNVIV